MTNNKATVIEWLMTYGWAILVVLAAIGSLAYFGVLNPDLTQWSDDPTIKENVYDCGNFLIKGTEKNDGELSDASFFIKGADNNFSGDFAKAYYDRESCIDITEQWRASVENGSTDWEGNLLS